MHSVRARSVHYSRARRWMVGCGLALAAATAGAGGPRFITGTSGYAQAGVPMAWYTAQPMYFTDPGDLSSGVTHAQADAMVAAAAAVWNVPTANITLAQGGQLAEHVSGTNSYFNGTDVVFPSDVEATNSAAIQISIVYDSDGSITDLLLGGGASDPSGCSQNGVLESVDSFGSNATIQHAVIVLNGRCVGSNPQQLLQMQYQLTRVFGRVLGLAWSQLNDNVFTGVKPVTAAQMALWPLMHPIDVICGAYTYQCMQNPFTLRMDDVAALMALYPVMTTTSTKTRSSLNTVAMSGAVNFSTHQGMELVNVLASRSLTGSGSWEPYPVVSGLAGYLFQQNGGNPVSGPEPASENAGASALADEGAWSMAYIPSGTTGTSLFLSTEGINPLYSGEYAVGPYQRPALTISGGGVTSGAGAMTSGMSGTATFTQTTSAANWCQYPDGTETSPLASNATGWWNATLCAPGYTAWRKLTINANTSWTIEVTATNEFGAATLQKVQPVIGVWNASDAVGMLPTVASQAAAMNSMSLGMTQLSLPGSASSTPLRVAIADQFGGGRPDFMYTARILYASGVAPTQLGAGGGQIVITGMGFQLGNQVAINGVAATVLSWTSTQIVATAPAMAAAGASSGTAVDVAVTDASTGGSTDIQGAMKYVVGTIEQVQLVSAPATLETGMVARTPFAVRVFATDGVTPVASASVTFVVTGSGAGAALVTGCQSGPGCVVKTDATGLAQTPVMGIAAGGVTVKGTEMSGGASVQAAMVDADPVRTATINAVPQYLAAGASGSWSVALTATQDGAVAAGVPVAWSTTGAGFTLTPPGELTAANGTAGVVAQVNAIAGGSTNVVMGCAWSAVCGSWTVYGVASTQWAIAVSSGAGQSVRRGGMALVPVMMLVTDGAGHALPGAAVNIYQTAYAWEGACTVVGACAAAPVLATSQSSATSDGSGMVQVPALRVPGVAQMVKIAAATGTRGFATTSLAVTP
ncbi:MAG TPA: IPT/TIG domain-containing protein [Acidobacteriaceae bacterium]